MTDSLREIAHRFLGSCVWQCQEAHTEDCDALVKAIHSHTNALVAAAYAACAERADDIADAYGVELPDGDIVGQAAARRIATDIRSLTPADAARELERREDALIREALQIGQWAPQRMALNYDVLIKKVRDRMPSLSKPAPVERSNEND